MKKLTFIDNDDERRTKEDIHYTEDFLEMGCGLPKEYVKSMTLITDFWRMDRSEMAKTVYDAEGAIVTWSVYTPNGVYSSKSQLHHLLAGAGQYGIKGKIYIDSSGEIVRALNSFISDDQKNVFAVLNAINDNYIITAESWKPHRLVIDIKGYREPAFRLDPIDLNQLLS